VIPRPLFLSLASALGVGAILFHPAPHSTVEAVVPSAPPVSAEPGPPGRSDPADPEIQRLRSELETILASSGNRQSRWGVLAVSMDMGDTLLALNPHEPMVPASNVKLLTTAAALHYLGPDFRYRTFLLLDGVQDGEVLDGNVVLYGTGDPTFSQRFWPSETAALDSLARQLVNRGVRIIRGNLVVDGSFFSGPALQPDWKNEDLNDAFAAPVSALSLAENVVTVRVESGLWEGAQPSVFTTPEGAGLPVANLAHTVAQGSRSRIFLNRQTPDDPIGIEGEIPLGGADVWRRLPVGDPLRFVGVELKRSLEELGVRVDGDVVPVLEPSASPLSRDPILEGGGRNRIPRILAEMESPPLLDLLTIINKESHNFFAETVGKTLGRTVLGSGSFEGGAEAVTRFLTEEVGIPAEEIGIQDGSGLSETNRVSPSAFVQLLTYMAASPEWDMFLNTLPEAGTRRELSRMYRTPAAGNLRAKTGTLNRVSALSGIVRTRSGERILFSILSNAVASEYRAKRAEDQLGARLASLTRPLPQ